MLWSVPGLALTKSKINSGELTDKYPGVVEGFLPCKIPYYITEYSMRSLSQICDLKREK